MSESDVDVLVIGGSSRLSGGPMMGAGTHYQRAAGIDDDWEALFHDYMTLNHWQVEAAVVQRLVQRAGVGTSARMGRVAMHWTSRQRRNMSTRDSIPPGSLTVNFRRGNLT